MMTKSEVQEIKTCFIRNLHMGCLCDRRGQLNVWAVMQIDRLSALQVPLLSVQMDQSRLLGLLYVTAARCVSYCEL